MAQISPIHPRGLSGILHWPFFKHLLNQNGYSPDSNIYPLGQVYLHKAYHVKVEVKISLHIFGYVMWCPKNIFFKLNSINEQNKAHSKKNKFYLVSVIP